MFRGANAFNQDISSWNVNSVTTMYFMFYHADAFNQNIGGWNVSSVTTMYAMFMDAFAFNQDISGWTVSSVTNMSGMFSGASAFNQPLNSWDVSSVTDMGGMFNSASIFNQPLNSWDVSSVTNMSSMFRDASAFDQPLNSWDVSSVTNMYFMFLNITLSTANYDALLIGWAALDLYNGVNFHGGNSKYSSGIAATARASIIADDSWTITDGGLAPYISWDGSSGSDWNTAANWSGNAVPTSTDNVIIPDVANDPVIDIYTNAVCNILTMEPGATLTVSGNLIVGN